MSRIRPTLLGLVIALATALAPTAHASVLPAHGFYEGYDAHKRFVRFYYSSEKHQLINIIIGGVHFGNAPVQTPRWHHYCNHNLCTRGHWTADHHVSGIWNNTHAGGDVHFNAVWKGV